MISGVAIALLQSIVLYKRIPKALHWAVASAIGWTIGWIAIVIWLPPELDFLAPALIGTTTGITQWLVLRRLVYWSGWWIPLSIVAWTTGLSIIQGALTSGSIPGAITGLALVLLLRYSPKESTQVFLASES